MKKLWLFLSLLICSILFAGCHFKDNKIMDWDWMINEVDEPMTEEEYTPVEERTKALKENPWDWANNEDVYPTAWLQTLDTAVWVYPYASFFTSAFNSKDDVFILSFEIYSDDKEIKRFAIYDMDHHKRLFDCFDGWGGGYIQVDESIDIDSIDVMSCKEKYDEVIENLSLTIDIKPEILTIPDGIPSLEQLEDVVAVCHNNTPNCVIDCDDWNITRKSYIIPYKDWYIGYNYGWNGEWRGYGLTYKTFDNPCETIATTDEIFFWHSHYKYNKETFGYDEYPDNKVYINRWLRGGSPTDEVAKVLDCVAWKDMMEDDTCKREVDKYMYNLIVWNEKNEYFTKWMNKFKEDLDNNKFTTTKFWIERHEECYERYKFEDLLQKDWKINSQLTDDERKYYIKLQNDNLHECAMEYLNK